MHHASPTQKLQIHANTAKAIFVDVDHCDAAVETSITDNIKHICMCTCSQQTSSKVT